MSLLDIGFNLDSPVSTRAATLLIELQQNGLLNGARKI